MGRLMAVVLLVAVVGVLGQQDDMPTAEEIRQLMAQESEYGVPPIALGNKYISGGAGEGAQALNDGTFKYRQEVKSDERLPAYCNPPNPCPKGHSPERDNCMAPDEFENSAAFSKAYQEAQDCICDREHMRSCPTPQEQEQQEAAEQEMPNMQNEISELDDALQAYLEEKNDMHHPEVMAKKFMEALAADAAADGADEQVLTHRAKKG